MPHSPPSELVRQPGCMSGANRYPPAHAAEKSHRRWFRVFQQNRPVCAIRATPKRPLTIAEAEIQSWSRAICARQCGASSFRITCPPFITNRTLSSSVMSAMGSPATATRSPDPPADYIWVWPSRTPTTQAVPRHRGRRACAARSRVNWRAAPRSERPASAAFCQTRPR